MFTPRLRFTTYEEMNAGLLDQCEAYARRHSHPTIKDKTTWQVFEDERQSLVAYRGPCDGSEPCDGRGWFDGFHARSAAV